MATQTVVAPTPSRAASTSQDTAARFTGLQAQLLAHYSVTAASRFVQLARPPIRTHLLEAGAGEPLVILHGGDGEAVNWAPVMAPLQHQAHLFAVDRPGFGLSDPFDYRRVNLRAHAADFVVSVLDALNLESATLVGGSMGGFFTLATALAHPERVQRVVLVGYAVGLTASAPLPLRLIAGVPGMARLFMRNRGTMAAQRKQYRTMFHIDPDTVPDLYFETRMAGTRLPSEQGTWATLLTRVAGLGGVRSDVYLGDELWQIRMPALVIWGEHDMAPAEEGRAATARIPQGQFELLPGIGHHPFLEVPDRTAELIVRFLDAHPSQRQQSTMPPEG